MSAGTWGQITTVAVIVVAWGLLLRSYLKYEKKAAASERKKQELVRLIHSPEDPFWGEWRAREGYAAKLRGFRVIPDYFKTPAEPIREYDEIPFALTDYEESQSDEGTTPDRAA